MRARNINASAQRIQKPTLIAAPSRINSQVTLNENDITICSGPSGLRTAFRPGDTIGESYVLTRFIGRGGMGSVYECKHKIMGNTYALKLLTDGMVNSDLWLRFQAEGKALARLNHPGIVTIYNMGVEGGGAPYFVMELLKGQGLDVKLEHRGSLEVEQALKIAIQVADALGCAHQKGIIHRDVKPSNLMLVYNEASPEPQVKLVDFGIARLSKTSFGTQSKTATGAIFGTPYYMSPEQCLGLPVDERSDIYSLGCTLFETLTGKPPFTGESALQTLMMHQTDEQPSLQSQAAGKVFPSSLEMAIQKMLAKDKKDRYQTMEQLKHDLERILAGKPIVMRSAYESAAATGAPAIDDVEEDSSDAAEDRPALSKNGALAILACILALFVAVTAVIVYASQQDHKTAAVKTAKAEDELPDTQAFDYVHKEQLEAYGATKKEINSLRFFPGALYQNAADLFAEEYEMKYFKRNLKWSKPQGGSQMPSLFTFPQDLYLGLIKIDDQQPKFAAGDIQVKPGSKVVFYTRYATRHYPDMLEGFGPNDLTGLEMVYHFDVCTGPATVDHKRNSVTETLKIVQKWKRLEELSLFNSIVKSVPGHEEHDESSLYPAALPVIDHMKSLKSLGLCSPLISGDMVARMSILNTLNTIKLKRIKNIEPLLYRLASSNNIKEVWLIGENTDDAQLRILTRMQNLETLHIRWSKLTPNSLGIFQQMKSLKHLVLDKNNWSDEDKSRFKENLPDCQFEPVIETRYWASFSDDYARKNFPEQFKYAQSK